MNDLKIKPNSNKKREVAFIYGDSVYLYRTTNGTESELFDIYPIERKYLNDLIDSLKQLHGTDENTKSLLDDLETARRRGYPDSSISRIVERYNASGKSTTVDLSVYGKDGTLSNRGRTGGENSQSFEGDRLGFAVRPQYTAQFFQDKEELEKRFPSSLPNKYYDHVTLKFKPGEVDTTKLGEEEDVHIIGRLQTEKVDALLVESPKSSNEYPHITLATAEGIVPNDSNDEIKNNLYKVVPLDEYVQAKEGASLNGMRVYKTDETHGLFGEILTDYTHNAQGAVEKLKELQSGEAVGALYHESVGDIDLVWGYDGTGKSDGFGLAKLVKFHPEVVDNLQGLLDEMEVVSQSSNRINLESEYYKAGISLDWDGEKKTWLLTEYKKEDATDKSTHTTSNQSPDLLGSLQQTSSLADKGTTSSSSDKKILKKIQLALLSVQRARHWQTSEAQ